MTPRRVYVGLISRMWRQHWIALLLISIGVAAFQFVITRIAPAPGKSGFVDGVIALLPPDISQMAYEQFQIGSAGGVMAFGYLHPFFLALCSAWVIRVGTGALAGEIGRGTMDLMASRPVPRWTLVASAALTSGVGLAVIMGAAFSASAIGMRLRPELDMVTDQVRLVAMMSWLLFMAWAGVTLVISATRREAGPAIGWAAGVIVTSFVIEFLGRVWKPIGWASPFSLFAYYHPQLLINEGYMKHEPWILGLVAAVAIALSAVLFQKRDL